MLRFALVPLMLFGNLVLVAHLLFTHTKLVHLGSSTTFSSDGGYLPFSAHLCSHHLLRAGLAQVGKVVCASRVSDYLFVPDGVGFFSCVVDFSPKLRLGVQQPGVRLIGKAVLRHARVHKLLVRFAKLRCELSSTRVGIE